MNAFSSVRLWRYLARWWNQKEPEAGPAAGVTFAAQGSSVKHLDIPLSKEPADTATALFTGILQEVEPDRAVVLLQAQPVRQSVCRQTGAGIHGIYHATFIPVPEHC